MAIGFGDRGDGAGTEAVVERQQLVDVVLVGEGLAVGALGIEELVVRLVDLLAVGCVRRDGRRWPDARTGCRVLLLLVIQPVQVTAQFLSLRPFPV